MGTPIGSRYEIFGSSVFQKERRWYVQTGDNNLRLPYYHVRSEGNIGQFYYQQPDVLYDTLYNKAYEKLKGKIADEAQLGVAALEWKKSLGMITARLGQLYDLSRSLKQLRFADAYSYLTLDPFAGLKKHEKRERRNRIQDLTLARDARVLADRGMRVRDFLRDSGGAQLEKSFGWVPMMGDIYKAARILDRPIRPKTVRGRADAGHSYKSVSYSFGYPIRTSGEGTAKVQLIADVRVTNPNLAMTNHLGLVNPLSVAWELVPWSFAVDWFANVGQMLATFSDFVGLDLSQPATTKTCYSEAERRPDPIFGLDNLYLKNYQFERQTGPFVGPTLQFSNPFEGLSAGRAINMCSLLLGQISKGPAKFNRVI
jgi:hypothetical protein